MHTSSSRLAIHLQITDINDNIPRFVQKIFELEYEEGLAANRHLMTLEAHDPDAGVNGEIRYELVATDSGDAEHGEIGNTFRVDPIKGDLVLRRKLELSGIGRKKMWQFSVRARDVGSGKYTMALVNLKITDVNNHKPEISITFFVVPRYFRSYLLE